MALVLAAPLKEGSISETGSAGSLGPQLQKANTLAAISAPKVLLMLFILPDFEILCKNTQNLTTIKQLNGQQINKRLIFVTSKLQDYVSYWYRWRLGFRENHRR